MDGTSRRRRLGLVAIAVAALASAATTSAMPTPELSSTEEGTFTLTAEQPIAWLDVGAIDNQALRAAGGTTTIKISGQPDDVGVLLIAGDPTRPQDSVGQAGGVYTYTSCIADQACSATVRLTAILLDPVANPEVEVAWTATAETRFPDAGSPVPAATLAVTVSPVQTGTPDALGLAVTKPETIELGPDLPRAVRKVHFSLPAGPVPESAVRPGAVLMTTDLSDGPSGRPPVTIRVLQDDQVISPEWPAGLVSLFGACEPGAPCEVDLTIEFDWIGGTATGSAIYWSLAAWPGVSVGVPIAAAEIAVEDPAEVAWDPALTASVSGQSVVTPKDGDRVSMTATLDLQGDRGANDLKGLFRLTFRAALEPGADPRAAVRAYFGDSVDAGVIKPGMAAVVYSRAVEVVCTRGSVCVAPFVVSLTRGSSDLPGATVDWTADVEFVPLTAEGVPNDADLRIEAPGRSP